MARIMKVRTIPRGYVHNEEMRDFVKEKCTKESCRVVYGIV